MARAFLEVSRAIVLLLAVAMALPVQAGSGVHVVEVAIEVSNSSGSHLSDIELEIPLAPAIPGIQSRRDVSADMPMTSEVRRGRDTAVVQGGSFAPGERRQIHVRQTVESAGGSDVSGLGDYLEAARSGFQYQGYRSRSAANATISTGDCTEVAMSLLNALRADGIAAELVFGLAIGQEEGARASLVPHDWVLMEGSGGHRSVDAAAFLLPMQDPDYVILSSVGSTSIREPYVRANHIEAEVNLKFRLIQ